MDRHAPCIEGRDSGRSEHRDVLGAFLLKALEESGLSGAGLSRYEHVGARVFHEAPCEV